MISYTGKFKELRLDYMIRYEIAEKERIFNSDRSQISKNYIYDIAKGDHQ